jgi:hypothetical protein
MLIAAESSRGMVSALLGTLEGKDAQFVLSYIVWPGEAPDPLRGRVAASAWHGGSPPGSDWVWAVQVHDDWAVTDERDDELLGLVQWVHVTVSEADGDMEEAARLHFGAIPALRPELEAEATPNDVSQHFTIAVVVPARANASLDTPSDVQGPLCGERDLPGDSRRRIARLQSARSDRGNSIRICHASRSSWSLEANARGR